MNSKKLSKFFFGLLASILVFGCISLNRARCMVNEDVENAGPPDIHLDPSTNLPDELNTLPLIWQAIVDGNPGEVKRFLDSDNGRTLHVLYRKYGRGAVRLFDIICDYFPDGACDERKCSFLDARIKEKKIMGCAEVILQYCAENNIHLHVQTGTFVKHHLFDETNLWDSGLRELFLKYQAKYKAPNGEDLFTFGCI